MLEKNQAGSIIFKKENLKNEDERYAKFKFDI
jgi:hypothetical protein